mgnify:CR=1 FL=1
MTITNTEMNVLKVMAEKDIDWTWMTLDRTLAIRGIPGYSHVPKIIQSLEINGLVDSVENKAKFQPLFRVSKQGYDYLKQALKQQNVLD